MKSHRSFARICHLILYAALLLSAFLVLGISGCGGGSADSKTGTLAVSLTDAPACGFDEVNVTINKVRIHQSSSAAENDANWSEIILDPARKINLLDLNNGILIDLGETPLDVGHYTQLRLVLDENDGPTLANSVIPNGTSSELELKTPSAMQSGLKLIHPFDVNAEERVDLLLDFDACKSVVKRGNGEYLLKPVIRVIPFSVNGIEGFVSPAANVTISAQQNGNIIRSTVASPGTGKFFISHLAPATYDVVITADGYATTVVRDVPVASDTSTTVISTFAKPISQATSGSNTISGTITLTPPIPGTTTIAEATAKQSISSTTTVAVKSQSIDILSHNDYSLILPSAAPWLGSYNGTLPITFTEQPSATGNYNIEGSADGYATEIAFTSGTATETINLTLLLLATP